MEITGQVTKLVENKIGKIIDKDLKQKISEKDTDFDVETYVNYLLEEYFDSNEIQNLKETIRLDSYHDFIDFGSGNSTEDLTSLQDSFDSNESNNYHIEEVIRNLKTGPKDLERRTLQALEVSAEEFIGQASWNEIQDCLQRILYMKEEKELQGLVLRIFQKLLRCLKKPQITTKGFSSTCNVLTNLIQLFNSEDKEEVNKPDKKSAVVRFKNLNSINPEVLVKLMWLLFDSQLKIAVKWVGFNETKFREVLISFIQCLSATTTFENEKITGLELLSILDPTANWCRYWCHSVVGRSVLCSVLRKYKNYLIFMIETILRYIKRKSSRLPSLAEGEKVNSRLKSSQKLKGNLKNNSGDNIRSAPVRYHSTLIQDQNKGIIENIPKEVLTEAVFFHCASFTSELIQYRSGRALFPVQTETRNRLLSVQDVSLIIIQYLETADYNRVDSVGFTSQYKTEIVKMLEILRRVKTHVHSSRMSAERKPFAYL